MKRTGVRVEPADLLLIRQAAAAEGRHAQRRAPLFDGPPQSAILATRAAVALGLPAPDEALYGVDLDTGELIAP